MAIHKQIAQLGAGTIEIETGKLAKLADGAVTVRLGETIVIVTAVSATKIKEGLDFFPLSVEYKEKASAAGRFPGGYFKREGRPTEKEILTCRMTDRPLRPLFPKGYFYETQIVALLLSADGENDSDILAMNGASAALCVSDIPFAGPIGAVRVALIGPLPSIGLPSASTTRPSRPLPTGASTMARVRLTVWPSLMSRSEPKITIPTLSLSRLSAMPRMPFSNSTISPAWTLSRP